MIRLKNINKTFNQTGPSPVTAIKDVSLEMDGTRITVFRGPSGSGKTTLLAIIGCMCRPTSGRVYVLDQDVSRLPERFMSEVRRNTFGFVFQQLNLIKGLTAIENVMIPAYPKGEKFSRLKKKAADLFEMLDIGRLIYSKVEWLSGGEAQRVAIARALINHPQFLIADEPTAHLDSILSLEFMKLMERLSDEGKRVLIASHDPIVFESRLVERIIDMRDGRIVSEGAGKCSSILR